MGSIAGRPTAPELAPHGLCLWHLKMDGKRAIFCMIKDAPDGFVLRALATTDADLCFIEWHPSIVSILNRADALRSRLLQQGWSEVDTEVG